MNKSKKERPSSTNIYENELEDKIFQLEALGGKRAVKKYINLIKFNIRTLDENIHNSWAEYITLLKEYYK